MDIRLPAQGWQWGSVEMALSATGVLSWLCGAVIRFRWRWRLIVHPDDCAPSRPPPCAYLAPRATTCAASQDPIPLQSRPAQYLCPRSRSGRSAHATSAQPLGDVAPDARAGVLERLRVSSRLRVELDAVATLIAVDHLCWQRGSGLLTNAGLLCKPRVISAESSSYPLPRVVNTV
jgi:hypothetical protein